MLLSAYEQGLFPWYSEGEPVIWHSPDPRFVLFPEKLHVSASMKKVLKRGDFSITFDRNFAGVITACSQIDRPGQKGTWITADVINAYTELHHLGWAHSAEAYRDEEPEAGAPKTDTAPEKRASAPVLAGGCYGIRLGNCFFGESMFSRTNNASKAAFLTLARFLFDDGVRFIDCQVHTDHLESLGAEEISRKDFLALLHDTLSSRPAETDAADRRGPWRLAR